MKKRVFRAGAGMFGEGVPKICVPIVDRDREHIWKKAEQIAALPIDIVEWRADFYEAVSDPEQVCATLKGLKTRLGEKTVLLPFGQKERAGSRPSRRMPIIA